MFIALLCTNKTIETFSLLFKNIENISINHFGCNNIDDKSLDIFIKYSDHIKDIESLTMITAGIMDKISEESYQKFINILPKMKKLKEIGFSLPNLITSKENNDNVDGSISLFCDKLKNIPSLESIYIKSRINYPSINHFIDYLKDSKVKNFGVFCIDLDLSTLSKFNEYSKSLDRILVNTLQCHEIGNEGLSILSKLLNSNLESEFLFLPNNKIDDNGIIQFCKSFSEESTIKAIILVNNPITIIGFKELCNNLHYFPNLVSLMIDGIEIKDDGMKYLSQYFKDIPHLQQLSVESIYIIIFIYVYYRLFIKSKFS